jgi:tRNA A37 threonylcarbamoyladenosine synthetase subunit TsaC/SUA5/YrdC
VEATPKIGKLIPMNRKTIGVRIPDNPLTLEIIRHLGHPVFSSSVYDPEDEMADYLSDPQQIENVYGDKVDVIVDGGYGNLYPTTVVELHENSLVILREGLGEVDSLN